MEKDLPKKIIVGDSIVFTNMYLEITTPNKVMGFIEDSRHAPIVGMLAAGITDEGEIYIGMQTDSKFELGCVLTADEAYEIAKYLRLAVEVQGKKQ